jgi:hypothetical protein
MNDPYRVVVTRQDQYLLAEIPGVDCASTAAGNPEELDFLVRDCLAAALQLPDGAAADLELLWEWPA